MGATACGCDLCSIADQNIDSVEPLGDKSLKVATKIPVLSLAHAIPSTFAERPDGRRT